MTKRQARRIIWERLAATARADLDIGDWIIDELERIGSKNEEADVQRLEDASRYVADVIKRTFLKRKS